MALCKLDEVWVDDSDEKLYRRTGDTFTEVSPTVDPTKSFIVNIVYPVGCFYVQYPNASSNTDSTEFPTAYRPATLFGGTWAEQWSTESIYFRTRGSLSDSGRVNGSQPDAIRNITGSINNIQKQGTAAFALTGAFGERSDIYSSSGNSSGGSPARGIDFDASRVVATASENRVVNRRIKVWKRTA